MMDMLIWYATYQIRNKALDIFLGVQNFKLFKLYTLSSMGEIKNVKQIKVSSGCWIFLEQFHDG